MKIINRLASFLLFVLTLAFTEAIGQNSISIKELRFIGEVDIPHKKLFKGSTIGGLSGIDYDVKDNLYYIISDDRSAINPARFYTAKIYLTAKGIDSVQFVDVHSFLQSGGKEYPSFGIDPQHTPDPEAIRYNAAKQQLLWTSEGERLIIENKKTILQDPSITIVTTDGHYIDSMPIPANTAMHATENGTRQNGGFEALTFTPDFKMLLFNVETPLYEDGPLATVEKNDPWIRIYQYDVATKNNVAQYAYHLDPIAYPAKPETAFKINGMPDMLSLGDGQLITLERSFSTGRAPCTIKVFVTDLRHADNIIAVTSLIKNPPLHPAQKKLLLNMDDLGIYTDNIEGVTFGPDLPNGRKTLIFVSDDNFQAFEKTQFLLFEIIPN